jgi:hypothetical protein
MQRTYYRFHGKLLEMEIKMSVITSFFINNACAKISLVHISMECAPQKIGK